MPSHGFLFYTKAMLSEQLPIVVGNMTVMGLGVSDMDNEEIVVSFDMITSHTDGKRFICQFAISITFVIKLIKHNPYKLRKFNMIKFLLNSMELLGSCKLPYIE